jgi:hypothetical protein
MQTRTESCSRAVFGLAALTLVLASCGGGGGGGDGGNGGAGNPGGSATARLECKVTDFATGKPVAEATVNYQAKTQTFTTQTNANGNCLMDMPAAEVVGVQYPAGTVTKSGYEPQTILCEALRAGNSCYQEVSLIPLATNVSIPVGGDTVMHFGDDDFEGSSNSQFQKPTDGAELVFPIADWATQVKASGVTRAVVYLDAKGWQSDICRNQISITGDVGTQTLPGGVSPPEGYWAGGRQVPFEFDVAQIGPLNASLKITSGVCSGTTDIDDFETNRIRVEFN